MAIVLDGNLGITTPAETVQGALTTTGNTILGDASTDTLNVGNGGLVKDASGNVGIGTASPAAKLNVTGHSSNLIASFNKGATTQGYVRLSNSAQSYDTYVDINNNGSNVWALFDATSSQYIDSYNPGASGYRAFYTVGSERMRIDSSGNLLVGTTNTSATAGAGIKVSFGDPANPLVKSVVADSSGAYSTWNLYSTNAGAYRFFVTTAGAVNATSITITAISDQRLKENVRDIDRGLDAIMALKPRRFDWKEGKGQDKKDVAGFIAQEFEAVFPECVGTSIAGADGIEYKNINHETLIPTLVKAIQELKAIVDAQAVRIAALEL